jgi:hypothetical protein
MREKAGLGPGDSGTTAANASSREIPESRAHRDPFLRMVPLRKS